jgi:parallel beta-helix repeat protein
VIGHRCRAEAVVLATLVIAAPRAAVAGDGTGGGTAPCIRLSRAGTQVQGDVRVCPGRYRIADPGERGVVIAAASGTRIDLGGVTIESGDSVPTRFVGVGIVSRNVDGVTVLGGVIRGYRYGVRLEGGRNHRISGIDVSGSRRQALRSTETATDTLDRLDAARPDVFEQYGGGILLRGATGGSVTGVTARHAQNGIGLIDATGVYVADNDVSDNNGWGVHLYRASHNTIVRNQVSRTRRCLAPFADCGAAAVLLREGSDSNIISDNDLTYSNIAVLVSGAAPLTRGSAGNLVYRNDGSLATAAAFVARNIWSIVFLENRVDSAAAGFALAGLSGGTIRGNTVIGARRAAIDARAGGDNSFEANALLGGPVGILVEGSEARAVPSRAYRIDDNLLAGVDQGIVLKRVTESRVRGNVFDSVGDGLVVDGAGHGTEVSGNVFLRATGWFIEAPDLVAGGNYWATPDAPRAAARVRGRVSVLPWKPASAAGY